MKKEILQDLINEGYTTTKISKILKKSKTCIRYWVQKFGLGELYKSKSHYGKGKYLKHSKVEVETVIKSSLTLREAILKLGKNDSSSAYKAIRNSILIYDIDTSNLLSATDIAKRLHKSGKLRTASDSEIFIKDSKCSRACAKTRIIKNNLIPYICNQCKSDGLWMGKKLVLILDHINGINNDHRLENLRFLCPNCNSLLPTHCLGKNRLDNKTSCSLTD